VKGMIKEMEMTKKRVRFAPSPTGLLHIGNARAAVLNWLFAKKYGAEFLLRMDDTDQERSEVTYADQIHKDLAWLGIVPDVYAKQSDRFGRYEEITQRLKDTGRLYPCYETPEELEFKRKLSLGRGEPPIYDRGALALSQSERDALEAQGLKPHWRFLLEDGEISWVDGIRGPVSFQAKHLSDPVLIRADGFPVYTLASVVDDMDLEVTHIIRGEDHVTNSAVQLQLFAAIGADVGQIHMAHFSLVSDAKGAGFSKREGSLSLKTLAEQGICAMTLMSLMAQLGTSHDIHPTWDMQALVDGFDFKNFSRSSPKFDPDDLVKLNQILLHQMPYEKAQELLPADLKALVGEPLWMAVRGNLDTIQDVLQWYKIVYEGPQGCASDVNKEVVAAALELFPAACPFDETTWGLWTKDVGAKLNLKGRPLFMPLRQALTGVDHGPEMRLLLPLIGADEALKRLRFVIPA
jgi:glutamyl-tRNA synthetase